MRPHETACDFFTKISKHIPVPQLSFFKPHGQIRAGEVIAFCGRPNSGKTSLAMHCAVQAISPKQFGGSELHVVWIACNGVPDFHLLKDLVVARCSNQGDAGGTTFEIGIKGSSSSLHMTDKMVQNSLSRFKYLHCKSAIDLFIAMRKIYLMCTKQKAKKIGAIFVDPASWYWHCDKYLNQKKAVRMAFNLLLSTRKTFQLAIVAVRSSFQKRCTDYWVHDEKGIDVCVHFPVMDSGSSHHHGLFFSSFDKHVTHRITLSTYTPKDHTETSIAALMPSQLGSWGHGHTSLCIDGSGAVKRGQ